ncbi:MAG TPA: glutaredoxin family protein [Bacillales bacterium]|nr:glutaredoxin family protein [Bacillales bacterium]
MRTTVTVDFYTKKNCPLCEDALELLNELAREMEIEVKPFDIYEDDQLLEAYQLKIPVIAVDGHELGYGKFSREPLRKKLNGFRADLID